MFFVTTLYLSAAAQRSQYPVENAVVFELRGESGENRIRERLSITTVALRRGGRQAVSGRRHEGLRREQGRRRLGESARMSALSEPCPSYEPHFWKMGKCKNCFFSRAEHKRYRKELQAEDDVSAGDVSPHEAAEADSGRLQLKRREARDEMKQLRKERKALASKHSELRDTMMTMEAQMLDYKETKQENDILTKGNAPACTLSFSVNLSPSIAPPLLSPSFLFFSGSPMLSLPLSLL